jgi:uncharacterized lipoprotein YddW (UPF0748 family)
MPTHILTTHPEWKCRDGSGALVPNDGYTWIAPTDGYIEHYRQIVRELVTNYEVDGVHVDRIRTPQKDACYDANGELKALYDQEKAAGRVADWGAFSTERITKMVEVIYRETVAIRPQALVSVAAWGIYKKFAGCGTSQGLDYNQDTVAWMEKGIVDALAPMTYWDFGAYNGCADWGRHADFFKANSHGRQIIMGMHATELNSPGNMYTDNKVHMDRVINRINYARSLDLAGTIIFASNYFDQETYWDTMLSDPYATATDPTPIVHR